MADEPDLATQLRQTKALGRAMSQHAHRADADLAVAQARWHEAEARALRAYGTAHKAHAESVNLKDAIDELRDVWKHWFLDAHAGLTLRQVMEGIGGDLQRVLAIADGKDEGEG